jgi:hypothetical protein
MSDTTEPTTEAFSADGMDDAALYAEYDRVRTRGQELSAKSDLSAEEAAELSTLADRVTAVSDAITARENAAAELAAKRDAFSSLPERTAPVPPQKAQEPVSEPVTAPVAQEPVAVPSVSQMSAQEPVEPTAVRKSADVVTFQGRASATMAGLMGLNPNDVITDGKDIAIALIRNAQSHGRTGSPGTRQTIAQFHRTRPHVVDTENVNETNAILREARNERRLEGGNLAQTWFRSIEKGASLTAAAGWCAPSENDYDLCRNWDSPVGMLDVPTVTARRGGINYTDEPNFPEIYANAIATGGGSNFLTEAQVIADTAKTCSEIPCPEFEDRRLDIMALCIRVSFLQAAGFPEVVAAWEDGLRAAHEAEMNRIILADIIARAGAATVIPDTTPADSFTSALLAAVELAAEDTRYRYHMAWNATVEVVLPHWILPQMRADISRRSGWNGLNVSDAEIASWFATRNVRVQFVRGWQDGLITGGALDPAYPGGIAAPPYLTALPDTVSFLTWPAGSVMVARQDVVTLNNVYDAASLAQNEFTALFAEEGFAPIYPCPGQRLYTVGGCNMGPTGSQNLVCATEA